MAREWYYTKDGERQGPVTPQQLKQLSASGDLQPTDLIWKDGMAEWKKAGTVQKLFGDSVPTLTSAPSPTRTVEPSDQPGLLKKAKTKFAALTTPQKFLVGGVGGMGVFFFLCMACVDLEA